MVDHSNPEGYFFRLELNPDDRQKQLCNDTKITGHQSLAVHKLISVFEVGVDNPTNVLSIIAFD